MTMFACQFKHEMNIRNIKKRMSRMKKIHITNNSNIMKRIGTWRIFYGPTPPMPSTLPTHSTLPMPKLQPTSSLWTQPPMRPTPKFRPKPFLWTHTTHSTHARISTHAKIFGTYTTNVTHASTHPCYPCYLADSK